MTAPVASAADGTFSMPITRFFTPQIQREPWCASATQLMHQV